MNKSGSLPEIKSLKSKKKEVRRVNKSVVKRLYIREVKKIKLKNNSFFYKKPEDVSLDKQVKLLRKRKLIPVQSEVWLKTSKIDRPEISGLLKLQDSMKKAIYIPKFENLKEDSGVFASGLEGSLDSPQGTEGVDEFCLSINEYEEKLNFVKTRIKVIMTTLPKLRENLEIWPKSCSHYNDISNKIEKLVGLLKSYEIMKDKLNFAIRACEKTLEDKGKVFL